MIRDPLGRAIIRLNIARSLTSKIYIPTSNYPFSSIRRVGQSTKPLPKLYTLDLETLNSKPENSSFSRDNLYIARSLRGYIGKP